MYVPPHLRRRTLAAFFPPGVQACLRKVHAGRCASKRGILDYDSPGSGIDDVIADYVGQGKGRWSGGCCQGVRLRTHAVVGEGAIRHIERGHVVSPVCVAPSAKGV